MRTRFAEADATLARDDVTARATALAGDACDDDRAMLAWLESDAGTTALEAELSTVRQAAVTASVRGLMDQLPSEQRDEVLKAL